MRNSLQIGYAITAIVVLLVFGLNCKKDQAKESPILVTLVVSNIKPPTADCGGNITSQGSAPVTARGVCWSVKQNPTIQYKDSLTNNGAGPGKYTSVLNGLKNGMTYYVRAYATNSVGTGYGNQYTAVLPAVLPTISTSPVTAINDTTMSSGGVVTNNGGSAVLTRGVCWSKTKNPTIGDFFTSDGSGTGSFSSLIENVDRNATYYLRAYATNGAGTGYGNELSFSAAKLLAKDIDGNYYHFVTIASQVWMTENLKTTRFRDSTSISFVPDNSSWSNLITAGYCWYNDDESINKDKYGALYNWYAVSTGKLCPTGWHVPSENDWIILSANLGGESLAGGSLKEIGMVHWKNPNAGATNETGFTALPGGFRISTGEYDNIGSYGNWWSSTSTISNVANYRYIYFGNAFLTKSFISQKYGLSVRCVKN